MKRCWCLLAVLCAFAVTASAEVVRKVNVHSAGITITYYDSDTEVAKEEFDNNGNTVSRQGMIPDGAVKQYFENGKLAAEWTYKAGRKDGPARRYSGRGVLESETMYRAGRKHGVCREYYAHGKIETEDTYAAGVLEGSSKYYLKDGTLFREATYKNGKYDGPVRTYFASGKPGEEIIFVNGRREGTAKSYLSDTDQKPSVYFTYIDDHLIQVKQLGPNGAFVTGTNTPAAP